ncbi:heterokaryon incompatibility protein-domain-containing protein, partial [Copromyces sp. CBS 386.78]
MPPKKNEYIRTIPNDYTKYSPLGRDEIRLLRIRKLPHAHSTSPATPNTITDDDHTTLPPVQCELYRVKLPASQRPPFTALSYCWGDLRHTLPITVIFRDAELLQSTDHDEDPSGWNLPPTSSPVSEVVVENFNVTINLHAALHAFRADPSFKEDQFLWTDMLCINQDDLAERSYQVSLMRDIYDGSSLVEVWLG